MFDFVGTIMASYSLVFKIGTCVTLHGQGDFADVIKVKDLEIRINITGRRVLSM